MMKQKILKLLDQGVEYSIYIFIFFIPISIALVSIFACMAVGLFLIKQVLAPDFSSMSRNKVLFCLLSIFFICMAGSLINSGPLLAKSLKALFLKWGRFYLILWMMLDTFGTPGRIGKAIGVLLSSSMLVCFSTLSQMFFHFEFLRHKIGDANTITGPFSNNIDLATYLACVIPVVLSLSLWKWKRVLTRLFFCVMTTVLMVVVYYPHSRGSWIGLTAGLFLVAFAVNYRRLRKKTFWVLLSVAYLFVLPLIAFGLLLLHYDEERVALYHGSWRMIVEHPFFGKGLGTFMDYCVAYTHHPWPAYVHNCYLQIWAESGIFSLLSFLVFNGYVLYQSMRVVLRVPLTLNSLVLTGLCGGFLAIFVHSFFDTQLYSFQASFLFWVMLALTLAARSPCESL